MADGEVRWDGLCSWDASARVSALENIKQVVLKKSKAMAQDQGSRSPPAAEGLLTSANSAPGELNQMLARLLTLSKRCPFRDVREKTEAILKHIQELGIRIPRPLGQGPSRFIPEMEILQVSAEDPQMSSLFAESFTTLGHLDNITLVMVFHPRYLESFLKTQHYLLQMDGPLPLCYRHYIGIMAAARHQCSYLVNLHVNYFLQVGGDPKWLNGLENAPQKLQKLELVHAVVLLTHYHSLASFTFGCGINPEIHCDGGHTFRLLSVDGYCICDITNGNHDEYKMHAPDTDITTPEPSCEVEALMEKMKQIQECRDDVEASQEEKATRFEKEKRESMLDYSWEDHGYSLVNRLYPDVGQLIDEKFQIAYNLTYNTMAMHKDVDTSMLRRAIWNYIHCMFGIRYDDYDYGEINQLLDRSFKIYIKTVVCAPERTTNRMYDSFWRQFKHSEKVHVNLLLIEARMQAELLYALRAITRYMT
ncbi:Sestrin-1, partial [Ophiophagus hannah]